MEKKNNRTSLTLLFQEQRMHDMVTWVSNLFFFAWLYLNPWWRHQMETFSALLAIWFLRGIHRSPVKSPHKCQWRGALMLSLICALINSRVNNREAGDLRCHRAHYDVTVIHISVAFYVHCLFILTLVNIDNISHQIIAPFAKVIRYIIWWADNRIDSDSDSYSDWFWLILILILIDSDSDSYWFWFWFGMCN